MIANLGYNTVSNFGLSVGTTSGGSDLFDGSSDRLVYGPKAYRNVPLPAQEVFFTWWGGGGSPTRNIDFRVIKRT